MSRNSTQTDDSDGFGPMPAPVAQGRGPSKTTTKPPLDNPSSTGSSGTSITGSAAIQSVSEILLEFPQLQISGGSGTGSKIAAGSYTNRIQK
jgi:hypothetical protein